MRTTLITGAVLLTFGGSMLFFGCEGSESREKVDATVETMVGKEQTDQYQEVKEELKAIEAQQADRYKSLDAEE